MITQSVLVSTKKALGLDADYKEFDQELMLFINGVFSTLNQLGVGPINGFEIEDEEATWDSFLNMDSRFNMVKTFMVLSVRLLFDPPSIASVLTSFQSQIDQLGWRINVAYENEARPLNAPVPDRETTPSTSPVDVTYDDVVFNNATFTGGVISGGRP